MNQLQKPVPRWLGRGVREQRLVTNMSIDNLSFNTRKSLCNHLGELAGMELAEFLQHLKSRLESLERNKVDITRIVPDTVAPATVVDVTPVRSPATN